MTARPEYDVDVVVLYDENADLCQLKKAADEMTDKGESVLVVKSIPEKLRYRRLVEFNGKR